MLPETLVANLNDQFAAETALSQVKLLGLRRSVNLLGLRTINSTTAIGPTGHKLGAIGENQVFAPNDVISLEFALTGWTNLLLGTVRNPEDCI
jgi:hypothetical protein